MIDLYSDVNDVRVISPHSPAATGTISGQVINMAGYRGIVFTIAAGAQTTTGVTVVPVIKSGTTTGALTSCADTELIGTEAGAALSGTAGANGTSKIGYIGADQYVTCDLAVEVAATGIYSVTALLGAAIKKPVA